MLAVLLLAQAARHHVEAEQCGNVGGPPSKGGLCRVDGPKAPADQPEWLAALQKDRAAFVSRTGYSGGVFGVPELQWSKTAFVQPQFHPFDRFFYSRTAHNYTVDRWLDDLKTRYGGIDAALMWPNYPNIGIDDRSQYDYYRALPGGLEALARITSELRERGVWVLWTYFSWDTGTRRENASDAETIVSLLRQTGGAGINADSAPFVVRASRRPFLCNIFL